MIEPTAVTAREREDGYIAIWHPATGDLPGMRFHSTHDLLIRDCLDSINAWLAKPLGARALTSRLKKAKSPLDAKFLGVAIIVRQAIPATADETEPITAEDDHAA